MGARRLGLSVAAAHDAEAAPSPPCFSPYMIYCQPRQKRWPPRPQPASPAARQGSTSTLPTGSLPTTLSIHSTKFYIHWL